MIAKLFGVIDSVYKNWILLNVQGVGYKVFCSRKTLDQIPADGEAFSLFTETIVREDLIQLYGFATAAEQEWFNILISVQGVGMKAALAILSVGDPAQLAQAIQRQDKALITTAEGIGPKLAARLINELKDKVTHLILHPSSTTLPYSSPYPSPPSPNHDALSALINLGYRSSDAQQAIALGEEQGHNTVEALIKFSLVYLAKTA